MLRKRVIFTLLYESNNFNLSRNFRLQRVGGTEWLKLNYNFERIAHAIDELVILDVSRDEADFLNFCAVVSEIASECFIPISAGGKIDSLSKVRMLLRSGADKIVLNKTLHENKELVKEIATYFGQQSIVASIDLKKNTSNVYEVMIRNGSEALKNSAANIIDDISNLPIGEFYLNSIDQDGTGQGLDLGILNLMSIQSTVPVILAGGVGNSKHLLEGLNDHRVDAVATANLFNFIGDGLEKARNELLQKGIPLPRWDLQYFERIKEGRK